jgi:hypothetical protein
VKLRVLAFMTVAALAGVASGCGASAERATQSEDSGCVPTPPNGVAPPGEAASSAYLGNGELFTMLYYPQLDVAQRNIQPDGSGAEKFGWWADSRFSGDLRISGRRLDRNAPPVRARTQPASPETPFRGTGFWTAAIHFPSPGCWEVTGSLVGSSGEIGPSLRFVIDVVD